jgi:hypothetical protein
VLDGCECKIDIEVGPSQVMGAGPFHGHNLPNRGVLEPWKLPERYEQLAILHAQPEAVRRDSTHLDGRNGLATQRGFHFRSP